MKESMATLPADISQFSIPDDPRPWAKPMLIYQKNFEAKKIIFEIGPGYGEFLFHLAEENPDAKVIGVEAKKRRFFKLVTRARAQETPNLTLLCAEAEEVLEHLVEEGGLSEIHIQFPDPWPKRRHAKNRLMCEESLALFSKTLALGGRLFFTTDVNWYALDVAALFAKNLNFTPADPPSPIKTTPLPQFATYFSEKWRKEGRTFYYLEYQRVLPPLLP